MFLSKIKTPREWKIQLKICSFLQEKSFVIETDDGKWFGNKTFTKISIESIIGRYSRYKSKGAVTVERLGRAFPDFFGKLVLLKTFANWIDKMHAVTKQYNHTKNSSTEITTIKSFQKKRMKDLFIKDMLQKRKKVKAKKRGSS